MNDETKINVFDFFVGDYFKKKYSTPQPKDIYDFEEPTEPKENTLAKNINHE